MNRLFIIAVGWLSLANSGCVSNKLGQNLDVHYAEQKDVFAVMLGELSDEPREEIQWQKALARMKRHNISLARSAKMIEDADRMRQRHWRQLIPKLTAYVNLSQGLTSLLDVSRESASRSLIASFNIPNPFSFYGSLYAAALQSHNARLNHQHNERQAFVDLYNAFKYARDIRDEQQDVESEMMAMRTLTLDGGAEELYTLQKRWKFLDRRMRAHRINVNRVLNSPGANWDLIGELPDISFRENFHKIGIGEDFGKLALEMYAVRIESAILQSKQIKFRRWPSLSIGLSQPPLYSSASNTGIDVEDLRIFSGLGKTIELSDPLGLEQIQDAESRFEFTRQQMKQQMEREASQLLNTRDAYSQLLAMEVRLQQAIRLREESTAENAEVVLAELEALREHRKSLRDVRKQLNQLDLQYLIWYDKYWDT